MICTSIVIELWWELYWIDNIWKEINVNLISPTKPIKVMASDHRSILFIYPKEKFSEWILNFIFSYNIQYISSVFLCKVGYSSSSRNAGPLGKLFRLMTRCHDFDNGLQETYLVLKSSIVHIQVIMPNSFEVKTPSKS